MSDTTDRVDTVCEGCRTPLTIDIDLYNQAIRVDALILCNDCQDAIQ